MFKDILCETQSLDILQMQKFDLPSLLPEIKLYADPNSGALHLFAGCVDGTTVCYRNFFDFSLTSCLSCDNASERNVVEAIVKELGSFERVFKALDTISYWVEKVEGGELVEASKIGSVLMQLRTFHRNCVKISKSIYLYSLVGMLTLEAETLLSRLKVALASEKIRKDIFYGFNPVTVSWPEDANALLVERESLISGHVAVLEVYGTEIISGIYLVAGDRVALERLSVGGVSSAFFLEDNTSKETLECVARLWEPGSGDAMGFARKAYSAAKLLTSNV